MAVEAEAARQEASGKKVHVSGNANNRKIICAIIPLLCHHRKKSFAQGNVSTDNVARLSPPHPISTRNSIKNIFQGAFIFGWWMGAESGGGCG